MIAIRTSEDAVPNAWDLQATGSSTLSTLETGFPCNSELVCNEIRDEGAALKDV